MHMKKLNKNGVALAYQDRGAGSRAIVFIHWLGFDHSTFAPQIEFFSRTHRVIAMESGEACIRRTEFWSRKKGLPSGAPRAHPRRKEV